MWCLQEMMQAHEEHRYAAKYKTPGHHREKYDVQETVEEDDDQGRDDIDKQEENDIAWTEIEKRECRDIDDDNMGTATTASQV